MHIKRYTLRPFCPFVCSSITLALCLNIFTTWILIIVIFQYHTCRNITTKLLSFPGYYIIKSYYFNHLAICQKDTSYTHMQGGPKIGTIFVRLITSPIVNRFSKLFHCQNLEKICNNTIIKYPTAPQVCLYTTLWNIKCYKSNNFCTP